MCDKPFDSDETLDSHWRVEHIEPGHPKPIAEVANGMLTFVTRNIVR